MEEPIEELQADPAETPQPKSKPEPKPEPKPAVEDSPGNDSLDGKKIEIAPAKEVKKTGAG